MKKIIHFINARAKAQDQNPFIRWLDNDRIPAKVRLSKWLLAGGFFISGFKDLNSMILGYPQKEAARDWIKKAINNHTKEDSTHWGMYLSDIKKLGLDKEMKFTDSLKFLWGKKTETQRRATYRICWLSAKSEEPILRYCLIKSIESFGHVIFGRLAKVAGEFEKESGIRLTYLGKRHFKKETGGLLNQEDRKTEKRILEKSLDQPSRKLGLDIAKETCALIEGRWKEFHKLVTRI